MNVDRQLKADVDPFCVERGSVDNGLARIVPRKAVAPTDHRNEPCPFIVRCAWPAPTTARSRSVPQPIESSNRKASTTRREPTAPRSVRKFAATKNLTLPDEASRGGRECGRVSPAVLESAQTIEEGAEAIVRYALIPADGPTGGFFDRNGAAPW